MEVGSSKGNLNSTKHTHHSRGEKHTHLMEVASLGLTSPLVIGIVTVAVLVLVHLLCQ
jgi:hypothetical protein